MIDISGVEVKVGNLVSYRTNQGLKVGVVGSIVTKDFNIETAVVSGLELHRVFKVINEFKDMLDQRICVGDSVVYAALNRNKAVLRVYEIIELLHTGNVLVTGNREIPTNKVVRI